MTNFLKKRIFRSPIGDLYILVDENSIIGLYLQGQRYAPQNIDIIPTEEVAHPILNLACSWLDAYFLGKAPDPIELPLNPGGTVFQNQVWKQLSNIPYGKTVTYGQLASAIAEKNHGTPTSARAVGNAVGHNPISIMIPCHRVLGAGNTLSGYSGGGERKAWLLAHEGICF